MFKSQYVFVTILTSVSTLLLAAFVYWKGKTRPLNKVYSLWALCVGLWSFFLTLNIFAPSQEHAVLWCRVLHVWAIIIPAVYIHFVLLFLNKFESRRKLVYTLYGIAAVFVVLDFTPWFLTASYRSKFDFYVSEPRILYPFHFAVFLGSVSYVYWEVFRSLLETKGPTHKQVLYFFIATLSAYSGGITNYLINYDLLIFPLYPFGNYGVLAYVALIGFTIVRHHFLDIEVIIRRTLVFAGLFSAAFAVFASVTYLTQELLSGYVGISRALSLAISVLIIILGYDPLRKFLVNLTDRFLFQKPYDYRKFLRDASAGMSQIKSLHHLLNLVTHFVTMRMRVRSVAVLMHDEHENGFQFGYARGYLIKDEVKDGFKLEEKDPMIDYMRREHASLDYERVKEWVETGTKSVKKGSVQYHYDFGAIKKQMEELHATCCVPSFLGDRLKNILILGEKKSGDYYSDDDLNVLFTLAQESAIAIENARLYDQAIEKAKELEEINTRLESAQTDLLRALSDTESANKRLRDTHVQLIHEQKMATLGRLAASVGHEVNNPLTILSMNVSRAILKYRRDPDLKVSDILEVFSKMEQNISRIKAVVNTLTGLLKKSERGKFEPLSLKLVLEETLPLVRFQTYLENLSGTEVEFDIPGNTPLIKGDLERLQEVFLNLFINAYHAMAGKRLRKIVVTARPNQADPSMVTIEFSDNGSGMSDEVLRKVFSYGFTTKPAGKGSGMGLYMCRYIIELHGGDVKVRSKLGEGTTFVITLPIFREPPTSFEAEATAGL